MSQEAAQKVKGEGKSNDLIERIRKTPFFEPVWSELDGLIDPKSFIGRSAEQVEKFAATEVDPALVQYKEILETVEKAELHV